MRTLIVDCAGFPLKHLVYLTEENGKVQPAKQISLEDIADFANAKGVGTIYLMQGPAEYCVGVQEAIEAQLKTKYAENEIKVEILK